MYSKDDRLMPIRQFICFLCWGAVLCLPPGLLAHPISMSTAVADIYEDHVQVELRILTEDLMFYQSLEADQDQVLSRDDLVKGADAHRAFLTKYFRVLTKDGVVLEGEFTEVDAAEIPEEGVRLDQVMDIGVYFQYRIGLEERPDFLTFSQNFGGDDAPVPAVMDLILLQSGARLDFPVQIGPRSPHSVAIDWENPPRNDRMYWRERRDLMRQRREELLGITSYSSTYAYIYVEPHEIRFEILTPLLTLDTWLPVQREEKDILSVKEQEQLQDSLETFLREKCKAVVDGVEVTPNLSRLDFFTLDIRDFAKKAEKRPVGIQNARAGMILTFSTKGAPKAASIEWNLFNDFTPLLNTMVYIFDGKGERHFFTENEPVWTWQHEGEMPEARSWLSLPKAPELPIMRVSILGLICSFLGVIALLAGVVRIRLWWVVGGVGLILVAGLVWPVGLRAMLHPFQDVPKISLQDQSMVAEALLKNVYRAFDYGDDEQVYDALERSASGEFLESLYLQIKKGLVIQDQGGARSRVREVKWLSGEPESYPENEVGFALKIQWEVTGTVEHWGHIHTRQHAYQAVLKVSGVNREWKIVDLQVVSEDQIKSVTGLRNAA